VFHDEIAKSISDLEIKLESIRERANTIEFRLDSVETAVTSMKSTPHHDTDLKDVITELNAIKSAQRETALKANDNEQYSRRNNLRFKGLPVKPTDDCRTAVVDFVRKHMHINIDLSDVDVAHPVTSKNSTLVKSAEPGGVNSSSTHPVLLVKFKCREHRDKIIRGRKILKDSGVSIAEDLTGLNVQTMNRLDNDELVNNTWSWNGHVYATLKAAPNRKVLVRPYHSIHECI